MIEARRVFGELVLFLDPNRVTPGTEHAPGASRPACPLLEGGSLGTTRTGAPWRGPAGATGCWSSTTTAAARTGTTTRGAGLLADDGVGRISGVPAARSCRAGAMSRRRRSGLICSSGSSATASPDRVSGKAPRSHRCARPRRPVAASRAGSPQPDDVVRAAREEKVRQNQILRSGGGLRRYYLYEDFSYLAPLPEAIAWEPGARGAADGSAGSRRDCQNLARGQRGARQLSTRQKRSGSMRR